MAKKAPNPGNAQAQRIVNQLRAGGMSYAEIGRRVGRDSSLISQIGRKGNKGASLVGALQKVQSGAKSAPAPRRTTKGGSAAKTRRGVKTIPGTSNISVNTKTGDKTLLGGLDQVKGQGKYVKWRLTVSWVKSQTDKTYRNTGIDGHLPRGWTSDDLANRIRNPQAGDNWAPGDARAALKEIALSQNQGMYTAAGRVIDVHLYTTD